MAYGSPRRIDKQLLRALGIEKETIGLKNISDVIKFHRSKSRKFDKFNKVFSEWVKNYPERTLADFYTYCIANGVIKPV